MRNAIIPLPQADLTRPCALIIGSEGQWRERRISRSPRGLTIPTGGVESLNAAVSAAIILYEARRQRSRAMSLFDSVPFHEPPVTRTGRLPTACVPRRSTISPGRSIFSVPASRCARQIERDELTSIILWGRPGVGKTTLARI